MQPFRILILAILAVILTQAIAAKPLPRREREPETPTSNVVVMDTSLGRIVIQLYPDKAPVSVKNFLQYVDERYYDGTIIHRVVPSFVIQGGGHTPDMAAKKTRAPIRNEAANGLSNERGTIAVARRAEPDSGDAQFYINVVDNQSLDRANARDKVGYAVFGKVVEGMDVVDKIRSVKTGQQAGHAGVPLEPIVIRTVRRMPR